MYYPHVHVLSNFGIDIVHNETLLFHSSYSVMFQCWNANPEERPSFSALEQVMSKMEMEHEVMSYLLTEQHYTRRISKSTASLFLY